MGIYLVMKNNFKRSLQHRMLFMITFLLPIVLCCLFGLVRFDKVSLRVGILEPKQENWKGEEELYQLLGQSVGVSYAETNEESYHTDLMMGRFHIILDYRSAETLGEMKLISYQTATRQNLLRSAFEKMTRDNRPLKLVGYKSPGLSVTERSITMVFSLFLVFATIHASAYIRDRNNGNLVRYQYSGYHISEYLLGFLLYTFIITFLQALMCILSLSLLQPGFSLNPVKVLVMTAMIAVMGSGYGVILCSLSKSEVSANVTASSLAGIFSILGGTFVAVEAMPGLLRFLSYASPIRWIVELLQII